MRKELKIIGSRDRHVFTATFIRFGFRDGYKGPVKTILFYINGKKNPQASHNRLQISK